jgi:hypothetical protein
VTEVIKPKITKPLIIEESDEDWYNYKLRNKLK